MYIGVDNIVICFVLTTETDLNVMCKGGWIF